ncbi:MAG TPA: autotransporter-associated beta strand repeat-containing protein [Rariglobus sp.]|nr:autotransporter-associated beta strand repeat-containing protein [Rariglobus sp.]
MNTPSSLGFSQTRARNQDRPSSPAIALLLSALLGLSIAPAGHASTLYWDADAAGTGNATTGAGLGGTGTWNTSLSNWWPGSGTTDQAWVNGNNDTALFAGGVAGTVTLGSGITVGGLFFNTNNYTLVNGANTLTFGAANNTITLNNLPAATITGAVAGTGSNVTLSGGVLNGSVNPGTLTLNGTSTTGWSGTTTVGNGTTLALAGNNQALISTTGITLNGGGITLTNTSVAEAALNRVSDSAAITSNGGTITFNNSSIASTAYAETLGAVTLTSGQLNVISTNTNALGTSQILTLGGLAQSGTATVAFGGGGLGGVSTIKNQINVTGLAATAANQIIAPWATIGASAAAQTDYAVNNINAGTGNAFGIQGAGIAGSLQTTWLNSTDTYTQSTAQTLTATRTITALRNTTATATTQLGANTLETFGLLNGATTTWTIAASGAGVIRQNGTAAANLYVTTGAGAITISAPITDNTGALTLVKSGTGGTLTLSGTNTYTGATVVNAGTLQFAKEVSFYNNNTAGTGWTAANLVVNSGATAAFNVGGAGEFTSADIDTIKTLGFQSGSSLGLDTTNAGGNFTYANVIADANSGANVLGLTKLGTGNLTLTNANTYTGPTTINAGTLTLSGGNNRLATTGTVIFNGATGTLDLGSTNQTLAGLASASLTSTGTILGTGTLTLNGGYVQIGGTTGTQTITMAGLSNFIYDNAAGSFSVGGMTTPANGVLTLAATNVITAATFGVASNSAVSDGGHPGTVHLGQTNTINANTIQVGGTAGSGTLDFTAGLTAPTLTIRGTGGTSTDRAAVTIGSSGGFIATTNTFNMGTGVLDAKISTLLIGENTRASANPPLVTGTFTMGAGTLDATSIIVGKNIAGSSGTGGAAGNFNLNGGAVTTGTLTIANRVAAGTAGVTGTFNLNSGTLAATTINTGTGGNSTFNWVDGTLKNNTGVNQTVALLSVFNLNNTGNTSGTHNWDVSGSQTSTMSGIISGAGSLTKANTGTLTMAASAANTYTGTTTISDGKLIASVDGASTTLVNVGVTLALNSSTLTLSSGSVVNGQRIILSATTAPSTTSGTTFTTNTPYYVINASGNTFQVSTTLGGAAVAGPVTSVGSAVTATRGGAFGAGTSDVILGDAATTTLNGSPALLTGGAITIERGVTIADQATSGTYMIGGNTNNNSTFSGLVTANKSFTVSQIATTGGNALSITGGITGAGAGTKTVTFSNVGAVNVTTTGISDGIAGNLALMQAGSGLTTLSAANTYSGDTFVSAGTLATSGAGNFGAGNVTVFSGASLTFGNNASIGDLATLTFASTSTASSISLNFSGVETLGAVYDSVTATYLAGGTYTAAQLNSTFTTSVFTGIGSLTVSAIPEPSTYAALLGSMTLAGALWKRRRTVRS